VLRDPFHGTGGAPGTGSGPTGRREGPRTEGAAQGDGAEVLAASTPRKEAPDPQEAEEEGDVDRHHPPAQ